MCLNICAHQKDKDKYNFLIKYFYNAIKLEKYCTYLNQYYKFMIVFKYHVLFLLKKK